jgi:type III restriction enzyme
LYKKGVVFSNSKIPKSFTHIKSFKDLGMSKPKFRHQLSSGNGRTSNVFFELEKPVPLDEGTKSEGIRIPDIPKHVVRYALSRNPFYYFDNLSRYFPNIASIWDFIEDESIWVEWKSYSMEPQTAFRKFHILITFRH